MTEEKVMKKVKKVAKYTVNGLCVIGALIVGFNAIEGINIPHAAKIVQGIAVVNGVIGTYLLGQKTVKDIENGVAPLEDDLK